MNYLYLVAVSDLNRILLYQFSTKHNQFPGEWSLPQANCSEQPLAVDVVDAMKSMFDCRMSSVKLIENIIDAEGANHYFFEADISSDIELKDKKADYGYYTFQQLHYFNLPKIQLEMLGSVFASVNN